jgi:polysaccharide export outer membrane protein
MKSNLLSAALGLVFLLASCGVPKDVLYFQGLDDVTPEQLAQMDQNYTSRICPDDLLTITVTAWDPTIVTPFNPPVLAYASQGDVNVTNSVQLHTYLVDTDGNIDFPVLGKVHAAGLSKQALSANMQTEIARYVKDALVSVQIVNYKITFMGEISRPGALTVRNERITILDAIGQLGDLTINANRKNILIIRDNNGVKEFGRIDLTNPTALFSSSYYYLRQNDIVYIEPNRSKQKNARTSQAESFNMSIIQTCITAVNVIATLALAILSASRN